MIIFVRNNLLNKVWNLNAVLKNKYYWYMKIYRISLKIHGDMMFIGWWCGASAVYGKHHPPNSVFTCFYKFLCYLPRIPNTCYKVLIAGDNYIETLVSELNVR